MKLVIRFQLLEHGGYKYQLRPFHSIYGHKQCQEKVGILYDSSPNLCGFTNITLLLGNEATDDNGAGYNAKTERSKKRERLPYHDMQF